MDLNAVFAYIRHEETNICNFLADVVNYVNQSDVTIFNSGSIWADEILTEGMLSKKDIMKLIPLTDPMVKFKGKGWSIHLLLENGVSKVPNLEGRFPVISGIRFKYDSTKEPMERIDP